MEKLIENLLNIFSEESVNDVKVDTDSDGNTIIYITKKKDNIELQKIRAEIDDLDDDIFNEAAIKLKKTNYPAFEVMMTLENKNPNMNDIRTAYKIFKAEVKEIVDCRIKNYTEEANRLFNKYLNNNEGE